MPFKFGLMLTGLLNKPKFWMFFTRARFFMENWKIEDRNMDCDVKNVRNMEKYG